MAAIHELSAHQLVSAYSKRELSPLEVVRAALARMDAWEPKINAMYRVARAAALDQARESEARWRSAAPRSALDGVPLTIKENIYTRGDPAPIGTRANEHAPPQTADAPPAARVREAGCVLLGKTTMPDYEMLSSGVSSLHGVTRNPGASIAIPRARARGPALRRWPATRRSTAEPTSAAPCACQTTSNHEVDSGHWLTHTTKGDDPVHSAVARTSLPSTRLTGWPSPRSAATC